MLFRSLNADLFVYPSRYEGFGIPVIEALSCGIPVITSSTTALPEAGGDAALYFNPDDAEELAEKIKLLLANTSLCEQLKEAGLRHLEKFRPEETARHMMDLYTGIV